MVEFENISKSYGPVKALHQVSAEIAKGELFGLIGPDGAGKTSLFRILTSLLLPDEGTVKVCRFNPVDQYKEIRKRVGYMPGKFSLYQDLSVEENLEFYATVFGTTIQENYHLIKDIYCQIEPFKKRPAGKLSGGMKQKLALSCAMIHKPEVLILDEPTTGVDAVSRKEFWQMLKNLQKAGITILVSTPYMDEASLCDRVALIQKGRIMQIDSPEGIVNKFDKKLLAAKADNMFLLMNELKKCNVVGSVHAFGEYLHIGLLSDKTEAEEIRAFLGRDMHTNLEIKPAQANIEDCFMELMMRPNPA